MTIPNINLATAISQFLGLTAGNESSSAVTMGSPGSSGTDLTKLSDPVDSVQISYQAQAMMKRAQANKVIADRLLAELDRRSGKKPAKVRQTNPTTAGATSLLLPSRVTAGGSLPDFSKSLSTTSSEVHSIDENLFTQHLYDLKTGAMLSRQPGAPVTDSEASIVYQSLGVADPIQQDFLTYGMTDTMKSAFLYALNNKTMVIQHAEDVSGLNFELNAKCTTDSSGSIRGMSEQISWNENFLHSGDGDYSDGHGFFLSFLQGFGGALVTWGPAPSVGADSANAGKKAA